MGLLRSDHDAPRRHQTGFEIGSGIFVPPQTLFAAVLYRLGMRQSRRPQQTPVPVFYQARVRSFAGTLCGCECRRTAPGRERERCQRSADCRRLEEGRRKAAMGPRSSPDHVGLASGPREVCEADGVQQGCAIAEECRRRTPGHSAIGRSVYRRWLLIDCVR